MDRILWKSGNGLKANFWTDSWDSYSTLSEDNSWHDIRRQAESIWGSKVADYVVRVENRGKEKWMWHNLAELNLPPDLDNKMKTMLEDRSIKLSNKEDKIIWCGAKSGPYSIKVGYGILDSDLTEENWPTQLCWNESVFQRQVLLRG